ncbi:MAG: hypothetical protein O2854_03875 [Chloroflexi bacterium]|nr:hypothetical protein [Chloroflexota bacterium]
MADMTSTTLANWTPEIWSAKATVTYRSNTVNVPLLDHTWEPEIGVGRGDTVNIPHFSQNSSPNNRGAGTGTFGTGASITFDATTEGQTQLIVNRFYYKAFRQPVEAKAQAMPNYITMLQQGHGQAISLQVDADVASDNTNGFDAFTTVVGVDNVDLTDDDMLTIDTNLNNQNAPVGERYGVVSPATRASLLKIESIRNQLYSSSIGNLDGSKGAGYLGNVLTFALHMSNNLEAGTSGKKNAFFHREAIAFAEQVSITPQQDLNIEDGVFEQYISYMTCGFKIVKNLFGNEVDAK